MSGGLPHFPGYWLVAAVAVVVVVLVVVAVVGGAAGFPETEILICGSSEKKGDARSLGGFFDSPQRDCHRARLHP